jgi:hypothetical protein
MTRMFGPKIVTGLTTLFNVLALNLALVIASLPLLTAPAAVSAASATLDRWRLDGEDRVIRQFLAEFRDRWSLRTLAGLGIPMAVAVLGLAEVRHFARGAAPAHWAALSLAAGALLITLAASGYLAQLAADRPDLRPVDLWSASARLAVRNLLVAAPSSAVPMAGVALLAARDPAILLLGLPLFLLQAVKLIARSGLHRAGLAAGSGGIQAGHLGGVR